MAWNLGCKKIDKFHAVLKMHLFLRQYTNGKVYKFYAYF